MEPKTTLEKLGVLVPHWIEHNRNHGAEFRQWAAAARTECQGRLASLLDQSAANMDATGELLKKAGAEIGATAAAPDHIHGHAHEHDHHHHDH